MNKEIQEMKNVWTWFLTMMQQQGLSFVLLALGVYFFYQELEEVQEENKACTEQILQVYQEMVKQNHAVISANTATIEELKKWIDEQ